VVVKSFPVFSYFSMTITDEFIRIQVYFCATCFLCDLFRMSFGSPFNISKRVGRNKERERQQPTSSLPSILSFKIVVLLDASS
jgi:hypothetical protein